MSAKLPHSVDAQAELLRVLGHPTRLTILKALAHGELAVSEIAERMALAQPTLSQQLAAMRKTGLVTTRREAKQVFYAVDRESLAALRAIIDGIDPDMRDGERGGRESDRPHDESLGAAMFARVGSARP